MTSLIKVTIKGESTRGDSFMEASNHLTGDIPARIIAIGNPVTLIRGL
jgi:hypothetical protein